MTELHNTRITTARHRGTDDLRIKVDRTAWMERARCLGADPSVDNAEEARKFVTRYCRGCPVLAQCHAYGIEVKANSIVYGGTYFNVEGVPNQRWTDDPRCA